MTELEEKRLQKILRHIKHVQDNTLLLGQRLIEKGEGSLGLDLIANGQIHDNSKLRGVEWLNLHEDIKESNVELFELAAKHHITTNPHHPEYWGRIQEMPRIYVAEMVCDLSARSSEFGNDLRDWIKDKATKKYGFTLNSKVFKEIKFFTELLLDETFK